MASELISAKLPSLQLAPHHVLVRVRFAPKAEIGHSRPAHLSLDTFCKGHPLRLPGGNTHSVGNTPSIFAGNKKNRQDEARQYAVQHILRGVCWLHTTKSACEARPKRSEAVLAGVLWLHPGRNPTNHHFREVAPQKFAAKCPTSTSGLGWVWRRRLSKGVAPQKQNEKGLKSNSVGGTPWR